MSAMSLLQVRKEVGGTVEDTCWFGDCAGSNVAAPQWPILLCVLVEFVTLPVVFGARSSRAIGKGAAEGAIVAEDMFAVGARISSAQDVRDGVSWLTLVHMLVRSSSDTVRICTCHL